MSEAAFEKGDAFHNEVFQDREMMDKADVLRNDVARHAVLSDEDLIIERQLLRKVDRLIMPLVVLVYLLNYIDRNNYAAARLQGLEDELGLSDTQYQVGLSILFVGYVLMQVPSNAMLNYCGKPSWYLGFFIIVWGLVSALTSQVQGYGSIVACRFILGVVEAPFFAGVLFYLSKWYTKKELNLRMSLFYSGSLVSGAFGPLIAAGILSGMDGARGLSAWRWASILHTIDSVSNLTRLQLYIIEGTVTIFIGIIIVLVLPDFPHTWKRFSPEMKRVANHRMALDASEADVDTGGKMSHLRGAKAAFLDPRTYIFALAYHGITGAAGFQNFYPTLTKGLGYGNVVSLLLAAPPYVFTVFYSLGHGIMSDKYGKRFWFYIYPVPIVMAGAFIFMFAESFGPRYFSLFLLNFIFVMNGTIYAWIANAIPRPPAKRAAALAFFNSVGNAASIWTPFTYSGAPYYREAMGINIGLVGIAGICGVVMRFYLSYQNRQLERLESEGAVLTDRDMRKLEKTAELEGISVAEARVLQRGYRYII